MNSTTETEKENKSPSRADRLLDAARQASELRRYQTHPDVIALQVQRIRAWSSRLTWAGIIVGLAFTMTNVAQFAAQGAPIGSPRWVTAWLLDPMVSLILIGVLLAEQVTARYQVPIGGWPRVAKWAALASTYGMNTWSAWAAADAALIVLHSVPPLMVFVAVEASPAVRDRLTEAVFAAEKQARERVDSTGTVDPESTPLVDGESREAVEAVDLSSRGPVEGGQSASTIPAGQYQSRRSAPLVEGNSRPPVDPNSTGSPTPESRSTVEAISRSSRSSRPRLVDPRDRLVEAIESGWIDPRTGEPINPESTESIRRTLGIGAGKARELKRVNGWHRQTTS